jgi:hypothetical protein
MPASFNSRPSLSINAPPSRTAAAVASPMGVSLQGGAACARASPISIANAKAATPDIAMQRRFMMAAGHDK